MALTTESREALAQALDGNGWKVYETVPAVPIPPAVVITADSPWVVPERLGSHLNYRVRWRVLLVTSAKDNKKAQEDIEADVDQLLGFIPSGYVVDLIGPPSLSDTGAQGIVYTTELALSVHMKVG
jgi:hypothetical protein